MLCWCEQWLLFARRPAFALCRTQVVKEIINGHQLEIATLANLSSFTVSRTHDCVVFSSAILLFCCDFVINHVSISLDLQFFYLQCQWYNSQVITEIEADLSGYADSVVNESLSVYLELQTINSEDARLGKMKKIDELKKYVNLALFFRTHFNIASNKYKKVAHNAICILTQINMYQHNSWACLHGYLLGSFSNLLQNIFNFTLFYFTKIIDTLV